MTAPDATAGAPPASRFVGEWTGKAAPSMLPGACAGMPTAPAGQVAVAPAKPDATAAILAERGSRYGVFMEHARIAQALKVCMRTQAPLGKVENMSPDQREALDMIAHKLGRILNGDPDYADSWADIAGYARLVADRLEGVVR